MNLKMRSLLLMSVLAASAQLRTANVGTVDSQQLAVSLTAVSDNITQTSKSSTAIGQATYLDVKAYRLNHNDADLVTQSGLAIVAEIYQNLVDISNADENSAIFNGKLSINYAGRSYEIDIVNEQVNRLNEQRFGLLLTLDNLNTLAIGQAKISTHAATAEVMNRIAKGSGVRKSLARTLSESLAAAEALNNLTSYGRPTQFGPAGQQAAGVAKTLSIAGKDNVVAIAHALPADAAPVEHQAVTAAPQNRSIQYLAKLAGMSLADNTTTNDVIKALAKLYIEASPGDDIPLASVLSVGSSQKMPVAPDYTAEQALIAPGIIYSEQGEDVACVLRSDLNLANIIRPEPFQLLAGELEAVTLARFGHYSDVAAINAITAKIQTVIGWLNNEVARVNNDITAQDAIIANPDNQQADKDVAQAIKDSLQQELARLNSGIAVYNGMVEFIGNANGGYKYRPLPVNQEGDGPTRFNIADSDRSFFELAAVPGTGDNAGLYVVDTGLTTNNAANLIVRGADALPAIEGIDGDLRPLGVGRITVAGNFVPAQQDQFILPSQAPTNTAEALGLTTAMSNRLAIPTFQLDLPGENVDLLTADLAHMLRAFGVAQSTAAITVPGNPEMFGTYSNKQAEILEGVIKDQAKENKSRVAIIKKDGTVTQITAQGEMKDDQYHIEMSIPNSDDLVLYVNVAQVGDELVRTAQVYKWVLGAGLRVTFNQDKEITDVVYVTPENSSALLVPSLFASDSYEVRSLLVKIHGAELVNLIGKEEFAANEGVDLSKASEEIKAAIEKKYAAYVAKAKDEAKDTGLTDAEKAALKAKNPLLRDEVLNEKANAAALRQFLNNDLAQDQDLQAKLAAELSKTSKTVENASSEEIEAAAKALALDEATAKELFEDTVKARAEKLNKTNKLYVIGQDAVLDAINKDGINLAATYKAQGAQAVSNKLNDILNKVSNELKSGTDNSIVSGIISKLAAAQDTTVPAAKVELLKKLEADLAAVNANSKKQITVSNIMYSGDQAKAKLNKLIANAKTKAAAAA